MSVVLIEDDFTLDIEVVFDVAPGDVSRACTTNDGCDPTCASSCVSIGL